MMKFYLISIKNGKAAYKVSQGGSTFYEPADSLLTKNLVDFFDDNDKNKILTACGITIESTLESKGVYIFLALFSLFLTCLFVAIPLSQTKIEILNFIQPGGILIFPLTFVFLDSINEVFGRKKGRYVVIAASASMAIASLFIMISLKFISSNIKEHQSYIEVFSHLPVLLLTNSLCILVSDSANNMTYNFLKGYFRGKLLPLRCLISTTIGQLLYSLVWISIFFYHTLPWNDKLYFIFSNYEFKVVYGIVICIPLTVAIVSLIKMTIYKKL